MTAIHFEPSTGRFTKIEGGGAVASQAAVPPASAQSGRSEQPSPEIQRLLAKVNTAAALVRELLSNSQPTSNSAVAQSGVSDTLTAADLENPAELARKLEKLLKMPAGGDKSTDRLVHLIAQAVTKEAAAIQAGDTPKGEAELRKLILDQLVIPNLDAEILKATLTVIEDQGTIQALLKLLKTMEGGLPAPQTDCDELFLALLKEIQTDFDTALGERSPERTIKQIATEALETFDKRIGADVTEHESADRKLSAPFEHAARQLRDVLRSIRDLPDGMIDRELDVKLTRALDALEILQPDIRTEGDAELLSKATELREQLKTATAPAPRTAPDAKLKSSLPDILNSLSRLDPDSGFDAVRDLVESLEWSSGPQALPPVQLDSIKRLLQREPGAARILTLLQNLPEEALDGVTPHERELLAFARKHGEQQPFAATSMQELPGRAQVKRILSELADQMTLERGQRPAAAQVPARQAAEPRIDQLLSTQHFMREMAPLMNALGEPTTMLFPILFEGFLAKLHVSVPLRPQTAEEQIEGDSGNKGRSGVQPFQRLQAALEFPNLGPVRIDLAYRTAEMILILELEHEDAAAWINARTASLEVSLKRLGFKRASISVR